MIFLAFQSKNVFMEERTLLCNYNTSLTLYSESKSLLFLSSYKLLTNNVDNNHISVMFKPIFHL